MEARRSQFALKCMPSLTDFAFLMPIAFLFGRMDGVQTLLSDGDTGWHIRTGEWIVANHLVPTHDFFSFSKPNGVWYAWEWLSDVIFAGLNNLGGLPAVSLFSVLLLCLTLTLVFRLVRSRCNPLVGILITVVAGAASSVHWLARPHLFTLLFSALFFSALERVREGRTQFAGIPYYVLLPLGMVLWTNLHGGFLVGIVMICAYGGGEFLKVIFTPDPEVRVQARRQAIAYFTTATACLTATLVNPYTYHLHVHLAEYLRDPYASEHINEFFSLSFHHPAAIFFESLLLLSAISVFWYASQGRYTESLLLLAWGHAGLLAARNIPLFAIVSAPLVAATVQAWLDRVPELDAAQWLRTAGSRFNEIAAKTAETDAMPRFHLISVAGLALVAALLFAPAPPKRFRAEYDPKSYPAGAIAYLRQNLSARVFTNDEWGDYLIWRLYPAGKVFVDGRSDYYGSDFENKYVDVLNVKSDWEQTLAGFGIDTILLPPSAPLSGALKETTRWRVVYDDGVAVIFHSVQGGGRPTPVASLGGGAGRDRKVTKTTARDRAITDNNPKT